LLGNTCFNEAGNLAAASSICLKPESQHYFGGFGPGGKMRKREETAMTVARGGFSHVSDIVRGWRSTHWLVLVIAVLGVGVLYGIVNYGQTMRANALDQLRQTIADEDRAFCEKFGMHAGAPEFVACRQELGTIRQKQADRERAARDFF
jgi:hypothetical protein